MAIPANPAPSHRTNHFFSHNSAGASLSHAAWLGSQTNFKLVQSHDVVCCFSELFWVAGMNALLWGTLFGATRIITADAFTPELHLRLIEKHRITFAMNGVPKLLEMLRCEAIAKYDLSSLRHYCTVGSKPPPGTLRAFNAHFPNGRTYAFLGMTELATLFAGACTKYEDTGTAGQLMCDVEAIVVDDNGDRCGPNVDGELCLRPRYPPLGYYNDAEATAQAFDADGYFRTGDIARFDGANDLYVVDREKDIIRTNFKMISPTVIEAVLLRSPEIVGACVCGIPDGMCVEPAAAVIRTAGSTLTEQQTHAMVAGNTFRCDFAAYRL